jgi:hypothetical protein
MYEPHNLALQKKLEWLEWAEKPSSVKEIETFGQGDVIEEYVDNLEHSDTFYMDKHFCQMVDHARRTVPVDLVFDKTQLQSEEGWLLPEEPFEVPLINSISTMLDRYPEYKPRIHAVGWSKRSENVYRVMFYLEMPKSMTNGFSCWSFCVVADGESLQKRINEFESRQENGCRYVDTGLHEIRWFFTAIYMMAQKISVTERVRTPRTQKKQYKRVKRVAPETIKVVMLRRYQADKAKSKGNVDWKWQWSVRGHWRMQPYGDGTIKPIFIESFIKGPVGKPFKNPGILLFHAAK